MKKITYLVFASVISITACKKNDPDPPPPPPAPKASVMFANTCVGTDKVDGKVNDTTVSSAANISFLANTGYLQVNPAANAQVSFAQSSTNLPLDSTTMTLEGNKYYSAFVTGTISNFSMLVTTDDLTAPSTGKAKIRFVHLANDTLKLNATAGSVTIASGVTFKKAGNFTEVPAGTMNIVVGDPSPSTLHLTLTLNDQILEAGKIYTVIKTGIATGSGSSAYKLSVITNK